MNRRQFIGAATAATLATPAVRAAGDPRLLKFIPQADIALLDPTFAPALVTRNHAYMVYDTLYGVDDAVRPRPQMAAGHVIEEDGKTWKITLRDGLRFHDGEKVLARDAVASLKRWAKRDVYAISVFGQVDELAAHSDNVDAEHIVEQVIKATGVSEVHLSLTRGAKDLSTGANPAVKFAVDQPPTEIEYRTADEQSIRQVRGILDRLRS